MAAVLFQSRSLFAVNCDDGFRIETKDAGGVVIHMRDLGDSAISGGGLDAGIPRGNTDNAVEVAWPILVPAVLPVAKRARKHPYRPCHRRRPPAPWGRRIQ